MSVTTASRFPQRGPLNGQGAWGLRGRTVPVLAQRSQAPMDSRLEHDACMRPESRCARHVQRRECCLQNEAADGGVFVADKINNSVVHWAPGAEAGTIVETPSSALRHPTNVDHARPIVYSCVGVVAFTEAKSEMIALGQQQPAH